MISLMLTVRQSVLFSRRPQYWVLLGVDVGTSSDRFLGEGIYNTLPERENTKTQQIDENSRKYMHCV